MIAHALPRDAVATLAPIISAGLVAAGEVGVWVGSDMSVDAQSTYARKVSIRRDGGPRVDQVQDDARVAVNVWALTESDATTLARIVQRIVMQAPDGSVVLGTQSPSGPSVVPDASPHAHVYMTFEVVLSGS